MRYDSRVALRTPTLEDPAAWTVGAYLGEQLRELEERESQVRRDVPDSLHKMRVAIRRLRSALATYRPLLDRTVSDPLRDELKWLAGILGEVRDAEVMHERLTSVLAEWDGQGSGGDAGDRLVARLEEARRTGQVHVLEVLDGTRYARLLADLEALVADPPWRPRAHRPARKVLPGRVEHAWTRLRRLARAAEKADDPAERAARLHEVRKAAKRTRYAAESLVPLYGHPARELAREMTGLQDVLGAHQDSVVAEKLAIELGLRQLRDLERARQAECRERYVEVWHSASRRQLRRWLDT